MAAAKTLTAIFLPRPVHSYKGFPYGGGVKINKKINKNNFIHNFSSLFLLFFFFFIIIIKHKKITRIENSWIYFQFCSNIITYFTYFDLFR